jgi:uncharacterized membrane protein
MRASAIVSRTLPPGVAADTAAAASAGAIRSVSHSSASNSDLCVTSGERRRAGLQWHHLLTGTEGNPPDTVEGLEANTLADGFFHVATWFLVSAAMVMLVRAWQRGELAPPWRVQVGMLLAGWGVFNLVEGLIDHQLLGIHHVRDDLGGPLGWDLGFLAFGALLVAGGLLLAQVTAAGTPEDPPTRTASASR